MMVGVAAVLGIGMTRLGLPTFNSLVDKNVAFDILHPTAVVGLFVVLGVVALLGGVYPAVVLSSFQPTSVLKGSLSRTSKGIWLRRCLVVVQFGISAALGVSILVMDRQMEFVQTKDLGFTRKNILAVINPFEMRWDLMERYREVRDEFGRNPSILSATASRDFPGTRILSNVIWIPEADVKTEYRLPMLPMDEAFLETYEIKIVAGRGFSEELASDVTTAYVLTESAANTFGWDNKSALEKRIECPVIEKFGRPRGRVIGVVEDFHLNPLHHEMQPVVLLLWEVFHHNISLRYREGEPDAVVDHVEKVWERYQETIEPRYNDLEEMHEREYWKDSQLIKTSRVFGFIALIVACMGLMGLTAFTTLQRMKEIGVRKVLGGNAPGLVRLLTTEIIALVFLANLLAAPLGHWLATQWLGSFQNHVEIGTVDFLYVVFLSLLIAILTVSYQTLRAVQTNPVEVLRDE